MDTFANKNNILSENYEQLRTANFYNSIDKNLSTNKFVSNSEKRYKNK